MDDKLTALQRHLELKYEGHDFNWRESGNRRIFGLCPEHPDKNPSFNIFRYNDKSYYKCFSCGFHGSLYDFIQEGITPEQKEKYALNKENQKRLSESFAKMKDYLLNGDTVEAVFARKYLTEKRYLDMSVVKKGNVGLIAINEDYGIDDILSGENKISNYRGWLVFPHTNIKGDICRLKFREPDSKNIRTANIKGYEDEPAAFGLKGVGGRDSGDYLISPYIYITEGEFNYLQYLNSAGLGNVVSAGGKDNISLKLINTFLSLDFVPVIATDQDDAGKRQLRKIYEQTPAGNREKIVYCEYGVPSPDGTLQKDFDDIFKSKSSDGVNEILSSFKFKTLENLKEIIEEENFKKEERIEKFIEDNTQGEGLKEIYFDKYNILPTLSQRLYNIPADIEGQITDEVIFGVKIQFPAMFIIAGSTSAGKTEFALEIADHVAKQENHISMFYQYEGNEIDLQIRAKRKGIDNPNFYYKTTPTLDIIKKDVMRFKDKKMFILIDYYQLFARFLQTKAQSKNDSVRPFISEIFFFFTELIKKYKNICVCLLSSLSNEALKTLPSEPAGKINNMTVLSGLKEDGDIGYNMDYAYGIFSAHNGELEEEKFSISRKNRCYTALIPIKYARIGKSFKENKFYTFNIKTNRYEEYEI